MMKIVFFNKGTNEVVPDNSYWDYFVLGGEVFANNGRTCESQCAVVGFEDFIMECPQIGYRFVLEPSDWENIYHAVRSKGYATSGQCCEIADDIVEVLS